MARWRAIDALADCPDPVDTPLKMVPQADRDTLLLSLPATGNWELKG